MHFKVRDGTPIHQGKGLCHSCANSHVFRGAAESEVTVRCTLSDFTPLFINKPVVECSAYSNKTTKSLYEMKQIGWVLATKNGKVIGFLSAREAKDRIEKHEIDEAETD